MKQVTLSLETAREMYKSGNDALVKFALDNYTKEELEKKELPKRWCDIVNKDYGYYISTGSVILPQSFAPVEGNKNVLPTKELAEAMLALCQLLYLRDIYNDGWVPDWKNGVEYKFTINAVENDIRVYMYQYTSKALCFKSGSLRDEFLTNFRELIETAKPLI